MQFWRPPFYQLKLYLYLYYSYSHYKKIWVKCRIELLLRVHSPTLLPISYLHRCPISNRTKDSEFKARRDYHYTIGQYAEKIGIEPIRSAFQAATITISVTSLYEPEVG